MSLVSFLFYIGVDFVKIGASVIIMSTIGAITDAAIAISSPMREIFYHNPSISRKELFTFGIGLEWIFLEQYKYLILCLLWRLYGVAFMV